MLKDINYWEAESLASNYAWYNENSERMVYHVAQKLPNSFGLYDICGNVFEFCNDWYAYYDSLPQVDPHGPLEPVKDTLKVGQGGKYVLWSWRHAHYAQASV